MMGVIKVETFDVNATNGSTHTLTNTVPSLNSAFIRRTTSIDKQSGPVGSTGNASPNAACSAAELTATNTITFRQSTGTIKTVGEVWRYTGAASGPDEFIVRGRYAVVLSGTTASQAVSGIVDVNKCVPFVTGSTSTNTSTSAYDASTASCYIDATDTIRLERGSSDGTLTVYVTVVEFTGTNWKVGHGRSDDHDIAAKTITLTNGSDGISSGTYNTGGWDKAMIVEASLEGDSSETGLSDNLGCWVPGGTTSQAEFILHQDSAARNDGVAYCHVLAHEGLVVNRDSNTNWTEGNNSYTSVAWPTGASTTESLDELALEWFADTSGTGTAHARGRVSGRINSASTITAWVHRSGNNVRLDWGVVELAGVDGTTYGTISNVDGDNVVGNTQTNIVISGAGFGATQGAGTLFLTQNADGSGTSVQQLNIDSWNDTTVQFDITAGALADSDCYIRLTPDGGATLTAGVQVGVPPETYQEAIAAMANSPDHHWPFQNSYSDVISGATANASAESGTSFAATPIVRGDSHALLLDSDTDYTNPSNQSDMNDTASGTRRYIGGWIQLDKIAKNLVVIWEEGAQVNNFAFLNGFGNALMFQAADASGDYSQAYAEIKLTPNRPYFILGEWNASGFKSGDGALWLDGIRQPRTDGLPWEVSTFPSHTGSISWGHNPGEDLKVGDDRGVDATVIEFVSPNECLYAHWFSWFNKGMTDAEIRETLFAKGAPADQTIGGDTEANMQTAVNLLTGTTIPDWPCGIEIGNCTDGNFTLTLDNIAFNDRCTMPIRYMGSSILTIIKSNGTTFDESLCEAPYGGTILFQTPALVTVSGMPTGSTVVILNAADQTELGRTASSSGNFQQSVSVAAIDLVIIADDFKVLYQQNIAISGDKLIPVVLEPDYSYDNP